MALFHDCPKWNDDDEYMTRKSAWEDIQQFIPTDKVIWECFYGNGQSGAYLRELGFNVIHEPVNFFKNNLGELLLSNPPYAKKREVFERLKLLGKPFIMLVPTTVLHTKYFKEIFENEKIQLIIPYQKRQFDKPGLEKQKNNCSFYTLYVCWKINLEKDVILI